MGRFPARLRRVAGRLAPWLIFLLVLTVPTVVVMSWTGGWRGLLGLVQGRRVLLDSPQVNVGHVQSGETQQVLVGLRNLTFRKVAILGVDAQCRCSPVQAAFPVVLAPFEHRETSMVVVIPQSSPGQFLMRLRLITDVAADQEVFEIHGCIGERAATEG